MSKHLVRASMFCLTKIPACICKAACCPGKALCAHWQPANASRCLNNAMTCLRVRLLVDLSGNKFDDRQCSARLPGDPPFSNGCLLRFFSPAGFSFFFPCFGPYFLLRRIQWQLAATSLNIYWMIRKGSKNQFPHVYWLVLDEKHKHSHTCSALFYRIVKWIILYLTGRRKVERILRSSVVKIKLNHCHDFIAINWRKPSPGCPVRQFHQNQIATTVQKRKSHRLAGSKLGRLLS